MYLFSYNYGSKSGGYYHHDKDNRGYEHNGIGGAMAANCAGINAAWHGLSGLRGSAF